MCTGSTPSTVELVNALLDRRGAGGCWWSDRARWRLAANRLADNTFRTRAVDRRAVRRADQCVGPVGDRRPADRGAQSMRRGAVLHRTRRRRTRRRRTRAGVPEALYEPLFAGWVTPTPMLLPVVEAAAVIGRTGDSRLLRSVVGTGAKDVDGASPNWCGHGVLERRETDGWRFRHELFREVAIELAPPSQGRDLHARAARALVDAAPDGRTGLAAWSRATSSRPWLLRRGRRGLPEGLGQRPAPRRGA